MKYDIETFKHKLAALLREAESMGLDQREISFAMDHVRDNVLSEVENEA